jgi:molybdopterin synthase catalytic subunit
VYCAITEEPVSPLYAQRLVSHPSAGGIAVFCGVVRDHADGKAVARLRYESHVELAQKEMRRVLVALCAAESSVRIAAAHRIGDLAIGDVAVVVAVSSAHRAEAFEVCRSAIDRIKQTVPIWKKEWDPTGKAHWVNLNQG